MVILIDSNILFSMLVKKTGKTAEIFESLKDEHDLYISDVSFSELAKHQDKLLKISRLKRNDFEKLKQHLLSDLNILPNQFITPAAISEAYGLVKEVDLNDLPFVAAAIFLGGCLWTGDQKLYRGLVKGGFHQVYNSVTVQKLINL